MTLRTGLSVLFAAVAASFSAAVAVSTSSAAAAEVGPFQIANYNSGLCMDVSGASTSDGARIRQWTCHHGDNQLWHFKHQFSREQLTCRS